MTPLLLLSSVMLAVAMASADMIPQLLRHKVQVLREAGHSQSDVASRTGLSLATIRRVEREAAVSHADDALATRSRRIGRPSATQSFTDRVRAWLDAEPGLPTLELLRRARLDGYAGAKTAFYSLVAGLRPAPAVPIVRFEGLPGEFSQHDFGQVDVRFVDGHVERIHFFASRLKYSRFVAVSIVDDERVETLVRGVARHFEAFGGVPLMAVFDRPRTVVARSGKGRVVEQFNATFAQAMFEIGVGVEMCAPRSGQQKGSVERLVGWVKGSFFKCRRFLDRDDLAEQLRQWQQEVNTRIVSRATGEIPETLRLQEMARLRPIKVTADQLAIRVPVVVDLMGKVVYEGVSYTMPPECVSVPGTLTLYETRVAITAGKAQTEHRRRRPGEPEEVPSAVRAQRIAAVHGARAKLYEKRQQLLALGPDALAVITALLHAAPRRHPQAIERLHALLDEHGAIAMRVAFKTARDNEHESIAFIERTLEAGAT